jgi:HEAT repeat protein
MIVFDVLWIAVALYMVGAGIWKSSHSLRTPAHDPWAAAATGCDLWRVGESTWTTPHDQPRPVLRVDFKSWTDTDDSGERRERGTYVTIEAPDGGLVGLTLKPETGSTARAKKRGAREIETGDEDFDADFYVTGPATAVRAVLDGDTRRLLSSLLVEVDLTMTNGTLNGRVPLVATATHAGPPGALLPRALPLMLAAARRLVRPADLPAALARNARTDPQPGVRMHNLVSLLRDYPDGPATPPALRAACDDASDEVRVRAAIALGAEGQGTLVDVATCGYAEDGPMARAVAALGDRLSGPDLHTVLSHALRTRRLETGRACLSVLGRRAGPEDTAALARVLAVERGDLAVAAAQALAETGETMAAEPLLSALTRDRPAVQAAAAEALGRVGTARAILPLKELESRSRDDVIRRAARQAVASIQARLPGASPGQLSLADADTGALSLAEDETGRLSLDDGKKS